MRKKIIHLVDDEIVIHDIFKRIFVEPEYELRISENKPQAKSHHSADVDVVIMDQMIPGCSGLEIFKELKADDPQVRVIFLTAFGTIEAAIEAIQLGALDYLQKPFNNIELRHKVDRAIKEKKLKGENEQLRRTLNDRFAFENIIGRSPLLKKVLGIVESVADSNSTVLITGESGTGKELIAKAIHSNSNRRLMPFAAFNSSNIPATLFESLLFGYRKGAYTGAVADKKGIFEEADGGTVFFDEIATLTDETQSKILRVLQEKEIQPLGSNQVRKVDVRILAATNIDLLPRVKSGDFREDLYYRLNIINIHLPPLRERKEDIPLLADAFLKKFSCENNKAIKGMSPKFLRHLMDYSWPGNIRELQNAMLRAVLLSNAESLTPEALTPEILGVRSQRLETGGFNEKVDAYKRQLIVETLEKNNWVQKKTAEDLQLKPSTLYELIKRLGIEK
ncbi:MAG: sigma-54 dependent transcriptional regulator [Acidobacteria bacterium]|jgi:two-component system response regulator PilR (NtrC family)|nr:sigma-54 dependent transcriptional regulator [Acidobacteriota bacterium]